MTDYYVSVKKGSDGSEGTTDSAPFKTFKKGLSVLGEGDTLYLMSGEYVPGAEGLNQWRLKNLNGSAGSQITIRNYPGHKPVLSGKASGVETSKEAAGNNIKGYPQSNAWHKKSQALRNGELGGYVWANAQGLVDVTDCSYLVFEGLTLEYSLGKAFVMRGQEKPGGKCLNLETAHIATNHHITIRDCDMQWTRAQAATFKDSAYLTIEGCRLHYINYWVSAYQGAGGAGGMNFYHCFYVVYRNNVQHETFGEWFIADAREGLSAEIEVSDNIVFDCREGMQLQGVRHGKALRNFIYRTKHDQKDRWAAQHGTGIAVFARETGQTAGGTGGAGGTTGAGACGKGSEQPSYDILVANNICVNLTDAGIYLKVKEKATIPLREVRIANNTIINCGQNVSGVKQACVSFNMTLFKDIEFVNNIIYSDKANRALFMRYDKSGLLPKNNLYLTAPSETSYVSGPTSGPNKRIVDDPLFEGLEPPDKPAKGMPLQPGYNDASMFRVKGGSPALGAGVNLSSGGISPVWDFADAYNFKDNKTLARGAAWDIGAHQRDAQDQGGDPPTVSFTVNGKQSIVARAEEPLSFKVQAAGGRAPYVYHIDFGNGDWSTSGAAAYTYPISGTYTATARVTDADGLTAVAQVSVAVEQVPVGEENVKIEVSTLKVGDSSHAVTARPKAILTVAGKGIPGGAEQRAASISFGLWALNGGEYVATHYCLDNLASSRTRSNNYAGFSAIIENHPDPKISGHITGAGQTAVEWVWDGDTSGQQEIVTINFSGADIANVRTVPVELGDIGDVKELPGDYNFFIAAAAVDKSLSSGWFQADTMICWGHRDAGAETPQTATRSLTFGNGNNQEISDVRAAMNRDKIYAHSFSEAFLTIDRWDAAGIAFKAQGISQQGRTILVLAMKIDNHKIVIGDALLPTSGGSNPVNNLGINAQAGLFMSTNLPALNQQFSNNLAGGIQFHAVDGDGSHTIGIASSDNVETTVERSRSDEGFFSMNEAGGINREGSLSLIEGGYDMNMSLAGENKAAVMMVLFEEASVTSGINVDMTSFPERPMAGEVVTFTDVSSSINEKNSWLWDVGDGTAPYTDATFKHTYRKAGTYEVSLTVGDQTGNTATKQFAVTVSSPPPSFDAQAMIASAVTSGEESLDVSLSSAAITPGLGEDIARVMWIVARDDRSEEGDDEVVYVDFGDEVSFTITERGWYNLTATVTYGSDLQTGYSHTIYEAFYVYGPPVLQIVPGTAVGGSHAAPFAVNFHLLVDGVVATAENFKAISWDFNGDGRADSSAYEAQWTYTLSGSPRSETYMVKCTLTLVDGTVMTAELVDFITITNANGA